LTNTRKLLRWTPGTSSGDAQYPSGSGRWQERFGLGTSLNTGPLDERIFRPHIYNVSAAPSTWTNRLNGAVFTTLTQHDDGYSPSFPSTSSSYRLGGGDPGTASSGIDADIAE